MSEDLCGPERKRRSCLQPKRRTQFSERLFLYCLAPAASPQASRRRPSLEVREPRGLSQELVDDAVERARLRWMLERPDGERISDEVIDQLLAGARTEAEIAGPGGLLAQLTKRLVERAMEVELTDHVGYEPHCEPPGGAENTRNGTTPKTLITDQGKVPIDAPRDRNGSFEPRSSESASGGSWGSTRRSSRSTRGACRRATSRRTWRRCTA